MATPTITGMIISTISPSSQLMRSMKKTAVAMFITLQVTSMTNLVLAALAAALVADFR